MKKHIPLLFIGFIFLNIEAGYLIENHRESISNEDYHYKKGWDAAYSDMAKRREPVKLGNPDLKVARVSIKAAVIQDGGWEAGAVSGSTVTIDHDTAPVTVTNFPYIPGQEERDNERQR